MCTSRNRLCDEERGGGGFIFRFVFQRHSEWELVVGKRKFRSG